MSERQYYRDQANLHRKLHDLWKQRRNRWVSQTLGRLIGWQRGEENRAAFHENVASQYATLYVLCETASTQELATKLEQCIKRHMRYGLQDEDGDACKDIVMPLF